MITPAMLAVVTTVALPPMGLSGDETSCRQNTDSRVICDNRKSVSSIDELLAADQGIGDEHVRVLKGRENLKIGFRKRRNTTAFSRQYWEVVYADVDCVIRISSPIEEAPESIIATMKRCVGELGLKKKDTVMFVLYWNDLRQADAFQEKYCGCSVYREQLGFNQCILRACRPSAD